MSNKVQGVDIMILSDSIEVHISGDYTLNLSGGFESIEAAKTFAKSKGWQVINIYKGD